MQIIVEELLSKRHQQEIEEKQDQWLVENIERIELHSRIKLARTYGLTRDDLEEMTSRAMLEAMTKVRAKAFIPEHQQGWGCDPVVILKQVKARINGFLKDEVPAFQRQSSGRGVTDIYDRFNREGPVKDEDGNSCDIWEAYDNSGQDYFNSYAPSSEEALLHGEVWSIIEAVAEEYEGGPILLDVILGELSLKEASFILQASMPTLSKRKKAMVYRIKAALVEAGYNE
jgi:hypothetical protein